VPGRIAGEAAEQVRFSGSLFPPVSQLPEHLEVSREHWDSVADDWVEMGERNWASQTPTWGVWATPDLELLPPI
jgi:hypothetical protein